MKPIFHAFLSTTLFLTLTACTTPTIQTATPAIQTVTPLVPPSSVPPTSSSLFAVFEGITPCSAQDRPLPQIPADTNCEQMIWKITLQQDPTTGEPTTYTLDSAYGLPLQGTQRLQNDGTRIVMTGNWAMTKGTKTNPNAVVYQLSDTSQTAVSFVKIDDDILHVLNRDQTLMVGNAAWSYTLNRTDNRPIPADETPGSMPEDPRPPTPPAPANSSVLGIFEGRLPCHEIALEFTKLERYPGCIKIKSRLTLYSDQTTGAPSAYIYMGTSTIRYGTWTMLKDKNGDPDATIYQFQLDDGQAPVSFLKADENHLFLLDRSLNFLVGDASFSYTLSRKVSDTP